MSTLSFKKITWGRLGGGATATATATATSVVVQANDL
jgi:hypothetical protein